MTGTALIPLTHSTALTVTTKADDLGTLIKRSDTWHLRIRVPLRYKHVHTAREIHRSLKTGDEREAKARAALVEHQIFADLDAKLAGRTTPAEVSHYDAIVKLAAARGHSYKTADELAGGDLKEILKRLNTLTMANENPGSAASKALLGSIDRPKLTITEVAEGMFDRYPQEVRYKNEKQQKVWRARWTRPTSKLTEMLGFDPVFEDITRADAVSFRDALKDRVLEEDIKGASAQKDIQNLDQMWRKHFEALGLDSVEAPPSPFRELTRGLSRLDEESRKNEVSVDVIKKLIVPSTMSHMNEQLRDLVLILIETGARQSEITDLPPSSIFLDDKIPHIWIRLEKGSDVREIKNRGTARKIPLVGVALDAMRRHPEGFPKYRAKGTFSGEANLHLKAKNLLPEGVTIGGLRHSFESRLKNIGVHSDDRGELMGHSVKRIRGREHYGDAMSLEMKLKIHNQIAFSSEQKALPAPQ